MRCVWIGLALVACAHHPRGDEMETEVAGKYEHHPCDPKGADVAKYTEPPELEASLFPDERVLRGRCENRRHDSIYGPPRSVSELAQLLNQEAYARGDCTGVCEPMRAALPTLDDKHDLEDETLQRECTTATAKLGSDMRLGCRHVCLVERRLAASKVTFARLATGLFSFSHADIKTMDDAAVHQAWLAANLAMPPKRFKFSATANKTITAEGTMYPTGPSLRLALVEGDAGCGHSSWTVLPW